MAEVGFETKQLDPTVFVLTTILHSLPVPDPVLSALSSRGTNSTLMVPLFQVRKLSLSEDEENCPRPATQQ